MENRLYMWVAFALTIATILMPFECKSASAPTPLNENTKITITHEMHKDTHKLHFSMSPFWRNTSGGLFRLREF